MHAEHSTPPTGRSAASGRPPAPPGPTGAGLRVPHLRSPYPSEINPHTGYATQQALAWAGEVGLATGAAAAALDRQRFGLLAGRGHPDAGPADLVDLCCWYLWFAVLDDGYCDRPPAGAGAAWLADRLVLVARAVEEPGAPVADLAAEPVARAARDLAGRTAARAAGEQYRRLVAGFHATFFGLMWEQAARAVGAPVRLADYARMRRHSGALPAFLTLAEIYGTRPPDPQQVARPEVAEVVARIGNLIMWQNDIRSYPVERAGGAVLSLPTVLARERGLAPQAALDVAASLWRAEVDRYEAARVALGALRVPALDRYADRLHRLLAGFLTWPYETDRYDR